MNSKFPGVYTSISIMAGQQLFLLNLRAVTATMMVHKVRPVLPNTFAAFQICRTTILISDEVGKCTKKRTKTEYHCKYLVKLKFFSEVLKSKISRRYDKLNA